MDLKEYKEAKQQFMKVAQEALAKEFKAFFDKYPTIDAIRWKQYTPHFNDGDVCEFSRYEFDIRVGQADKSKEEVGTAELILAQETDDDGFYEGYDIDSDTPLGRAVKELEKSCSYDVDDAFQEAFGDGVEVVATRKGFTTEDYDHDQVMSNTIYKVTNKVNGKIYIGQTSKTLEKRRYEHEHDAAYDLSKNLTNQPFHAALLKHGVESFSWEVLKENLSDEEANIAETACIEEYDSFNDGYNATTGGKQHWFHSEETKQLIAEKASILSKEMWENPAHIDNMVAKTKASWEDEDIREHRTETIKAVRSSEEQRKVSSEDSKKRYEDVEARNKMAQACGAKPFDVIDKDGKTVGSWSNYAQCAKDLNFKSKDHIGRCLRGLEKSYCGFTFAFSETN